MIRVMDATGVELTLARPARRVVSIVPSTTETLFALGAGEQVVGVTRFCVRPPEARRQCRVVGGTKSPRVGTIQELEPELVVANQEENREKDVVALRQFVPVYVAFPGDVPGALAEIETLGHLVGRSAPAHSLSTELGAALEGLRRQADEHPRFRYLYLIWRRPYMAAGPQTFISAFLREAGGDNVVSVQGNRYPEISVEQIRALGPDVVLLSSEPFPFGEEHREDLLEEMGDDGRSRPACLLVDGQALSWHGARLKEGIPYLMRLTHHIVHVGASASSPGR